MLFSWFTSWRRRPAPTARKKPQRSTLRVERLETRDVPSVAPWTSYSPRFGDRVDALIGQLAPKTRDASTFYRNLNGWLSASISPRVPQWVGPNTYLTQLNGDCTVRAHIFQAVAQRLGTPVHLIIFSGVPYQGQHMAVEVLAGRGWQFFDPTSGIYLSAKRDRRHTPLGLFQARALGRGALVMDSTGPLLLGAWNKARVFKYLPARVNLVRYHGNPAFNLQATYFIAPAVVRPPDVLPPG